MILESDFSSTAQNTGNQWFGEEIILNEAFHNQAIVFSVSKVTKVILDKEGNMTLILSP